MICILTNCAVGFQVRDSLTARAREFNIMVDDIAITHLSFGTEVGAACLIHLQ